MSITANPKSSPPGRRPMHRPVFDQFLYRALHKVARGEIGTTSPTGALRHRTEDLSPGLVSALFVLYRDGFVALSNTPHRRDGWFVAEMSLTGTQLLGDWVRQLSASHLPG